MVERYNSRLRAIMRDVGSDELPTYCWPGGYPLFYFDNENNTLCPPCARREGMSTEVVNYDVNYEDTGLYCDDCGVRIGSAYGEDDVVTAETAVEV